MTEADLGLETSEYDFQLPDVLIARYPMRRRDQSRLMVLDRSSGTISHHRFTDLPEFLRKNDVLVMNDSKVFKARLATKRPSGGNVEFLLIRPSERSAPGEKSQREFWEAMARPAGRVKPGEALRVAIDEELVAHELIGEGRWLISFASRTARTRILKLAGHIPLPPYMRRGDEPSDLRRYQTVYARADAARSVAAPTAGFHFTKGLLTRLKAAGIRRSTVTLHVGPGTFLPVHAERLDKHVMEAEYAELPESTSTAIMSARQSGGRVIVVGTTTVRTLESASFRGSKPLPYSGPVNLFIRPGHTFRAVDALITNFHLPCSTLLVLVSTFAGRDLVRKAYLEAVKERYRFYSYGDAMLIL